MLRSLHIKNFKGWKDTEPVKLAPLTLFFGNNSSGKSSIGQFLLLLKQTAESPDRKAVLFAGDEKTPANLGSFSDLIHRHDVTAKLGFSLKWKLREPLVIRDALSKDEMSGDRMRFDAEPQAGGACISACADALLALRNRRNGQQIVVDETGLIIDEYRKSGLVRKQPRGPGSEFLLWLLTNQWNTQVCSRVALPVDGSGRLTNFPKVAALAQFDPQDRKFVGTSLAHASRPPILVSVDSDWAIAKIHLAQHGVTIIELCPDDLKILAHRKRRKRRGHRT